MRYFFVCSVLLVSACSEPSNQQTSVPQSQTNTQAPATPDMSYSQAVRCAQLAEFFATNDGQQAVRAQLDAEGQKTVQPILDSAFLNIAAARSIAMEKADLLNPRPNPVQELNGAAAGIAYQLQLDALAGDSRAVLTLISEYTNNCFSNQAIIARTIK